MNKRIFVLALSAVMLFSLCGCGGANVVSDTESDVKLTHSPDGIHPDSGGCKYSYEDWIEFQSTDVFSDYDCRTLDAVQGLYDRYLMVLEGSAHIEPCTYQFPMINGSIGSVNIPMDADWDTMSVEDYARFFRDGEPFCETVTVHIMGQTSATNDRRSWLSTCAIGAGEEGLRMWIVEPVRGLNLVTEHVGKFIRCLWKNNDGSISVEFKTLDELSGRNVIVEGVWFQPELVNYEPAGENESSGGKGLRDDEIYDWVYKMASENGYGFVKSVWLT